jgi:hypothetical protein
MLRLGVHGLSDSEAGLVRAYLMLAAGSNAARWTFVADGACDVLLADDTPQEAERASHRRGARLLTFLGDARLGMPNLLSRPLSAAQFEQWLRDVYQRLTESMPQERRAGEPRYRLRRWPPAQLLQSQSRRTRMAAALSRQPLSAAELASVTSLEPAECARFIQVLQAFQLLEPVPARAAAPQLAAATSVGWSLLRSIRRRLGLAE